MPVKCLMLAALGSVCAGCAAPPVDTALSTRNPANPNAATVPFVRPVNVLAAGAAPQASSPSAAMDQGSMPGMKMPGDPR